MQGDQELTDAALDGFHAMRGPVTNNRFPPGQELSGRVSKGPVTHSLTHSIQDPAHARVAATFLGAKMALLLTQKFLSKLGQITWRGDSERIIVIGRPSADTLTDLGVRFDLGAIVDSLVPYDVEIDTTDEDGEPTKMTVTHHKFLTSNILYGEPGAVEVYVDLEVYANEDNTEVTCDALFDVKLVADLGRYVEVK